MAKYLSKRVMTGLLCVIVALCLNFALIHLAPGDPIRILVGNKEPNPELVQVLTEKYGLDQPPLVQFEKYIGNLLHGDLGDSYYTGEPVQDIIKQKLPLTLFLAGTMVFIAVILGGLLGVFCAKRAGGKLDTFLGSFTYLFDSIPGYWLGLMLILLFASKLKLLPTTGLISIRESYTGFAHVLDVAKHLILPIATGVIGIVPYYFRITRASVIQQLGEDFIVTLRAAGMSEHKIFYKYVFRNAIIPTVTAVGIHLAYMIAGSTIIEIVFGLPGLGSYLMTSISRRDYPLLMGFYLILSVSVAVMMIVVDFLYTLLDPRVRHVSD